jgi:hypothetical protein
MFRHSLAALTGLLIIAFLAPAQTRSPGSDTKPPVKKAAPSKFIRVVRDDDGPTTLETAIVRYRPASGQGDLVVDLIGVVHIGERGYYKKLNKTFEQYDVLLYELVAQQGTRPKNSEKSDNLLRLVQKIMTVVLDLDSQIEHIDYSKKNFVHADLSPDEMAHAIKKRGDDGLTLALSIAADVLRQQNLMEQEQKKNPGKTPELPDLMSLLQDPTAPSKIKRLIAQQFEMLDSPAGGLGPTINRILVDDRNQAAMKVLQKEIAKGKKKIGIFYGAAHMADFEKRLRDELDLVPVSTQWLQAWDLRLRERTLEEMLFKLLRDGLP